MKSTDSVIVSWDFSRGKDVGVLIVGSQKNGRVDVINAYQGKEAYELYRKLTIQKKGAGKYMKLHPKTRKTIEDILEKMKTKLDEIKEKK